VVDDEEIICTLFAAMLGHYARYHVVTTTDGHQVMDILRREPFDVMLLDMSMPAISGLEVLRQVTQAFEELPVIIVTGHGSIEGAVESMQAGAADFVTKPVPAAVLHLRIQKALEHARTRRLASTDGVPGVCNHRTFQERLSQEIARAARYNRPLSVLMIDVDHFKVYNDTYGHPQGDIVFQDLAIIPPETDSVGAQKIGQRLCEQVERYPFPGKELMPGGTLTISIGVAM